MKEFKIITRIDRINFFSDLFIQYYLNFFKKKEFYFIVQDTVKDRIYEYLKNYGFQENQFHKYELKDFGFGLIINLQNYLQKKFTDEGYIVIYVDIDELLFSNDLKKTILNIKDDFICPKGYCLIHNKDEKNLDTNINIFEQRKKCYYDFEWYSKVCIMKKKYTWFSGRHNKEWYIKTENNILLLDIGKICKNMMVENNSKSNKLYNSVMERYSTENVLEIEENEYEKYYKKDLIDIPEIIMKNKNFLNVRK